MADEIEFCSPFLKRQIALVAPDPTLLTKRAPPGLRPDEAPTKTTHERYESTEDILTPEINLGEAGHGCQWQLRDGAPGRPIRPVSPR